jgi:hypothetical protein
MLDPHLMRDLALERQREMIEWRAQQRRFARLGEQESALKGLVKAVISRLETLNQPHVEEKPRAEQRRREA